MLFKLWMMKSWKDSFVGSTFRGNFESSIFGGNLKDLNNRAPEADNACMHATTAVDHAFSTATLQANLRRVLLLAGTDVASIGTVKGNVSNLVMLTHGSNPTWGAVRVSVNF